MLLFDHGERRSGVPAELERLGVDVRDGRLPARRTTLSHSTSSRAAKRVRLAVRRRSRMRL